MIEHAMNEEVRLSRLRISRRRALSLGGTLGLAGVLAACSGTGTTGSSATSSPAPVATGDELTALLDRANTCTLSAEQTQGPYWFDVDSIRSDIREDRPGTPLTLAVRVLDRTGCAAGAAGTAVPDVVVEVWHCDAGGAYSGFESGSASAGGGRPGGPPPSGPPPEGAPGAEPGGGSGETSNGSYSVGDREATTTDDGTYLRGAQAADAAGIVRFTTIYPGWYNGRTVHVHCKVHRDKRTVLTTQLYADDALTDQVHAAAPYDAHTGRDTTNDTDGIFDRSGLLTVQRSGEGYLGVINLVVDA